MAFKVSTIFDGLFVPLSLTTYTCERQGEGDVGRN